MDLHEPDILARHIDARLPSKRLPGKAQTAILLLVAGVAVTVFVIGPAALRQFSSAVPAQETSAVAAPASGTEPFKITDRQWAALKIQPVQERVFQDASETDGKIALDDDLETPVFSPYSGRVTRLLARSGDQVKKGDPLFGIQATELAQAQNDLITAVSGLRTARAQLNLATTNERRQHELYNAQGAALKDWQQAQVDLATAQGGMNGASIALAAVRNRLRIFGKSDSDIDQLETTADILRVDAETLVGAPIAGTVVQRQVGLGQNIVSASSGASSPVFMIGDLSKVWMIGNAREEDAPALHKGNVVEVRVLAIPNKVFKARLTYVASSIDTNTHRLAVRAEVDNPNGELKPEMFASFRIITSEDAVAPGVPESAVVYEGARAHVWLADAGSKALEIRPIKIGRSRDGLVEALQGLKPGDQIVTSGAVFIDRAVTGG
ncbi:MAG: rane fusion protein heavy metal efflux system [Acetobacteraceae bacterium]|nr:rane fusion protein heavy metal efflux system [Acetobacteraceae bacterium]